MENKETLGKRIAQLRKAKGYTQEQLAEKVGVSAQAVSKWENDISCPDITLLPLLADLFGVTVDELLGVKPVEPHVIVLDKDERKDDDQAKGNRDGFYWEWNKGSGKWSTIAFCIGMILVCLLFILRRMTPLFPDFVEGGITLKAWNYVWPLLVFTAGLITLGSSTAAGIAIMAFGGYEFVRRTLLPYGISLIGIPWYVILLIFAVALLVITIYHEIRGKRVYREHNGKHVKAPVMDVSQEDDRLEADMSFGSGVITYESETLKGGNIDTNFGEYTVDFTNVKTFAENCLVDVSQNFGSLTILLPRKVNLVKSSDTSFASFAVIGNADPDADQRVIIRGDVNFGTLQVKYQ
jgi:transcriptional regulator with XRE-family HTH domain/predicted membrane protein